MKPINSASSYFNENWKKYQGSIRKNTLYHREMSETLNTFLTALPSSFSFVDIGCGDASTIAPILLDKPIKKYIGIDAAPEVLKLAEANLGEIKCDKEFICDNMTNAIVKLSPPIDIIFTSYAAHHLTYQQKFDFIFNCKKILKNKGFFIMIDGVLKPHQTRDEWLDELENRIKTTQPMTSEELKFRMQHPRQDDHPESIATFEKIAKTQQWKKFDVLFEKDIFAFMVFTKA